jgi:hypothetical protein
VRPTIASVLRHETIHWPILHAYASVCGLQLTRSCVRSMPLGSAALAACGVSVSGNWIRVQRDMFEPGLDKFSLDHSRNGYDPSATAFTLALKAAWPLNRDFGAFRTNDMTERMIAHVWFMLWTISVDILGFVMVSDAVEATALIRCWFTLGNTHLRLLFTNGHGNDEDILRTFPVFKEFQDRISLTTDQSSPFA